jgi:Mrp family chromosome partitioning ATPase/capsular polysaccharide biosynthesis protein
MTRYLPSIKRYSWIIVVCVAVALIAGLVILRASPPAYVASSTLVVQAQSTAAGASALTTDPTRGIAEANLYATEVPSRDAMTLVSKLYPELAKRGYSTFALMHDVTATPDTNAATITIQATAKTPHDAVMMANDVASGFVAYVARQMQTQLDTLHSNLQHQLDSYQQQKSALEKTILATKATTTTTTSSGTNSTNVPGGPGVAGSGASNTNSTTTTSSNSALAVYTADLTSINQTIASLQSQLALLPAVATGDASAIQLATLADVTQSAKPILIAAATLLASLILAGLLIALMIYLDRSLLGEDDVKEKLGLPYLGGVSSEMTLAAAPASAGGIPAQESANIFAGLLLTHLIAAGGHDRGHQGSVVLVTSAREAEGKTTVACALAGSIARSGGSVALIDANLPQPATHLSLGIEPTGSGLSGLLTSEGPMEEALLQVGETPGLWLLPAGSAVETPTLLLQERLPEILSQIRQKVDVVIIDSPALLNSADGVLLANMSDYVAMVVDARHGKLGPLEYATDLLTSLSAAPVGVILNRLSRRRPIRYYANTLERRPAIAPRLPALAAPASAAGWRTTSGPAPVAPALANGVSNGNGNGNGSPGAMNSEA